MLVTIDGDQVEVDPQDVELEDDDPYLSQEEVDGIVSKRVKRAKRTAKQDLKDDDEFFSEAARERGIELRDDGRPKGSIRDEELQQLKKKASKVDSLTEQVETYESQITETRETQLENQLLTNTDGFQSEQAKKTFLREAKAKMTYDDEYGWAATGDDGIQYRAGEPVGPTQVIEDLKETHDFLFASKAAGDGPNVTPSSSSTGKKTWTEEEHASADPVSMDQETYDDWASAADEGRIQ